MIVISEKTLEWARSAGPCEHCRIWQTRRHPHHVIGRGHGGGNRLDLKAALLGLCPKCHSLYGDDPDYLWLFLQIIADREGFVDGEAVRDYLNLVLYQTPKEGPLPAAPVCPW